MASRVEDREGRGPIAERLRSLLASGVRGPEAARLVVFTRLLLRDAYPPLELSDQDAAAMVASALRFFAAPGPDLRVRVLTPRYVSEGWDAPFSIVETCISDRPFVVDSVREVLRAAGVEIRALLHPIFTVQRDQTGRLELLAPPEEPGAHESFLHIAIAPLDDPEAHARLEAAVQETLEHVHLVTEDFPSMVARAHALAGELEGVGRTAPAQLAAEGAAVADLLRWLVDGGFVFLGYREYDMAAGGTTGLVSREGTVLGLLRREERDLETPSAGEGRLLMVTKTLAESPVHRRASMDDLTVRELEPDGTLRGARRFLGLFTSKAYAEEAAEIPLLRRQLRQVLATEQAVPGSHDYKEIVAVFNVLPKAVLFASTAAELRDQVRMVMAATRTDDVVVSVGEPGPTGRVTVLVVLPRERFSGEAQERIHAVLTERLSGRVIDEHLRLGEGDHALLHFVVARPADAAPIPADLRAAIAAVVRTWEEGLAALLEERIGPVEGARVAARFGAAFPVDYQASIPIEQAADDVMRLARAERDGVMQVAFRPQAGVPATTGLRLYLPDAPLVLSESLSTLENLGLHVLSEDQVAVQPTDGGRTFIQTFVVQDRHGRALDADAVGTRLAEALVAARAGRITNDALNRLVLEGGLDWREVDCLRTYCGYAVQAGIATRPVAITALADHPETARALFDCFAARFRPGGTGESPDVPRQRFLASLDRVQSLREDRVLRTLLDCVDASVRTSAFAPPPAREAIAVKIRSTDLAHLPAPRPSYEIYVHAAGMEGVHLRAGKIARGGIRHSDRLDDFRTEVLGLMKTQTVKNAVIVPIGAKGGFVVKGAATPDAVLAAYKTFIASLLDVTDNLVGGRVVHPAGLVIHDEEDPYLVVAADKGTASFSDVANAIATRAGFWLGDAFASGGSNGYDHKRLGITARGAWECVRTHFRALGRDTDTESLTVAGIGDMGGDVFGNGLLRSPHLRLLAAFNHRHVFLDPDPDPARSYAERERLFRAGRGWDAYDPGVLSTGGAIVERAAKRVALSPEARAMLGLHEDGVSGERLVQAVLTLDVDLLFNGGIGTYVRASTESDAEVRDTANDAVRVRASALRCRVVAEGGNLGFTQRARVEYALAGGRIDTDAIDNSAGVDMSDHEVNLKVCLQAVVERGDLSVEARNRLLAEVTDDVVARVLAHNRSQSRALGVDELRSRTRLAEFRELMVELERAGGLDRVLEVLPDRDALRARRGVFQGLTRPELAILMAYTKIHLQRVLLASGVPDDALFAAVLAAYFPAPVVDRFSAAVHGHRLRREIVATEVVNTLVDAMGITFIHLVTRDTGASVPDAVRAWGVAWAFADGASVLERVRASDCPAEAETLAQQVLARTVARATAWLLANGDPARPAAELVVALGPPIARVRARLGEWLAGPEAETFHRLVTELEMAGLDGELARELATAEWLTGALDVVTVAAALGVEPEEAAGRYYGLGQQVDFAWLWARLMEAGEEDRWQQRAAAGLVDDVLRARRRLAHARPGALPLRPVAALEALIRDLRSLPRPSMAALQVVVHELRRLADAVPIERAR